jgi:hypothetical protein
VPLLGHERKLCRCLLQEVLDRGLKEDEQRTLTGTAVVGALRAGETTLWPAKGLVIGVEKGIFLLETEPGLGFLSFVKDLLSVVAVVSSVGSAVIVVGLSENKDVVSTAEGVFEDGGGTEVDVGIMAGSLIGRRTIKVPDTELADVGNLLADGLMISGYGIRVSGKQLLAASMRTVVLQRRPPSPSIQTSGGRRVSRQKRLGRERLTFGLDLVALIEGEVGRKEVVVVGIGHGVEQRKGGRKGDNG